MPAAQRRLISETAESSSRTAGWRIPARACRGGTGPACCPRRIPPQVRQPRITRLPVVVAGLHAGRTRASERVQHENVNIAPGPPAAAAEGPSDNPCSDKAPAPCRRTSGSCRPCAAGCAHGRGRRPRRDLPSRGRAAIAQVRGTGEVLAHTPGGVFLVITGTAKSARPHRHSWCAPARTPQPLASGHRTIACRAPGCEWIV